MTLARRDETLPANVLADRVVTRLREAEKALQQATTIHQAKLVADVASAQEVFATRQRLGEHVIGYAHEIKINSLARLGDLLKQMPKATGTRLAGREPGSNRGVGGAKQDPPTNIPTYADLGLDKKTASVAQQLASLDSVTREAIAQRETTIAQARRDARNAEPKSEVPQPRPTVDPVRAVAQLVTRIRNTEMAWPTDVPLEDLCLALEHEARRLRTRMEHTA